MSYMRKTLTSLPIIISTLVILVGCDEQTQQQQQPSTITQQTASQTPTSQWPGTFDETVVSNLTQTNIMVVYDASGSMAERACGSSRSKQKEAVPAMERFTNAVPADANLGLYVFNGPKTGLKLQLGTNNREQFQSVIEHITPDGGTPLLSAMKIGYDELTKQAKRQLGYGRYILLVVTDGEANAGEEPDRLIDKIVENTPIEIHAVGVCMSEQKSLRQEGRTWYTPATDPQKLVNGLQSVLAEVQNADPKDFKY